MKRKAIVGLIALIAILTLLVSAVDVSFAAEEPKDLELTKFQSVEVKITELESNGVVTAVLLNVNISIYNPNPVTVYTGYDFNIIDTEWHESYIRASYNVEISPYNSSLISLEKLIIDRSVIIHLTKDNPVIHLDYIETTYENGDYINPIGGISTGLPYIYVYNGSGVWPPPILPEHVRIKKIELNIEGEYPPHFIYMNVSFENPNPVVVLEWIRFFLKTTETTNFPTMSVLVKLPPNESTVISLEEVITDINIWTNLPKENPIIYVSWNEGKAWEKGEAEIVIYNGSGVWPTPSLVYVAVYVAKIQVYIVKILKTLPERPETILAIAGLVVVAYMLLQPKKKNLKIRTAARLGLLCLVLNLLGLGIFNPFYFIFIVAAILAYCCLLLKQKLSATVMMFVYSIIGAAIMVFFYLLFDVTFDWDYLHLARFVANALYLLPAEGIGGFIATILLGVSIGIIADFIYAILKSNEAHAAVVIGLVIAFVILSIFIGGLSSGPGGLEGPFLAIVFLILFPMIACGAGGGFVGYLIFNRLRNTEKVLKIQGS